MAPWARRIRNVFKVGMASQNMNKKVAIISGAFLSSIFLTTLVSAQSGPIEGLSTLLDWVIDIINIFIIFVSDLIFNINSFDEFLFAKIILFLLVYIILYTVLKKNEFISGDRKINIIIALAISILSIRFIPDDGFIVGILLPYTALGIALTTFIPFLLFFFFVHQSGIGTFGRRMAWVLFGVSFFTIWAMRADVMGDANYIYWLGLAFVILSLLFDKTIHTYFGYHELKKNREIGRSNRRVEATKKLSELEEDSGKGFYEGHRGEYTRKKAHYERVLRDSV